MGRKSPLEGVPRQLQEAAKRNLTLSEIARDLESFDDVLSLPRFANRGGWDALDNLSVATELVTAIVSELEKMKPSHLGKTKAEEQDRKWLIRLIDGTYALTEEWQAIPKLMPRREELIRERPGRSVSMRTHIDTDEREIHEELAERLANVPVRDNVIVAVSRAKDFSRQLHLVAWMTSNPLADRHPKKQPAERFVDDILYDFAKHIDDIYLACYLALLQAADLERSGIDNCDEDETRFIKAARFIMLHDKGLPTLGTRAESLLRTAVRSSEGEVTSFLEYLEARPRGQLLLEKWQSWAVYGLAKSLEVAFPHLLYRLEANLIGESVTRLLEDMAADEENTRSFVAYALLATAIRAGGPVPLARQLTLPLDSSGRDK